MSISSLEISEKIEIVKLELSDDVAFYVLIEENRDFLGEYLSWVDSVYDQSSTKEYLQKKLQSGLSGAQWFKILYQGQVSGLFGIKSIKGNTAELGYWISSSVQGRGVVSGIIESIMPYLRDHYGVRSVEFRCLEDNLPSIAVAKRFGAQHVKTIPIYYNGNKDIRNLTVYAIGL